MSALTVTGARKRYGEMRALDGLSLTVEPGEIHAIIGLNGAGKTTAMKAMVGHTSLDQGEVRIFETPAHEATGDQLSRLGFVIDQPFGYPELTVRANIEFAVRMHGIAAEPAQTLAQVWIDRLELARWQSRKARGLSLGNRQRLGLACVAAHAPDLLILDEPTNALDPAGVLLLRDVLLEASARGAGVLVSSHHLDEVSRIAHRISVLHAGQMIGTLQRGQVDVERHFFDLVREWDARHPVEVSA